jgi:hypothetical protein
MITTLHRARCLKSEKPVRPPYEQKRTEAARKFAQAHNDALSTNPRLKEAPKPGQGFVLVGGVMRPSPLAKVKMTGAGAVVIDKR